MEMYFENFIRSVDLHMASRSHLTGCDDKFLGPVAVPFCKRASWGDTRRTSAAHSENPGLVVNYEWLYINTPSYSISRIFNLVRVV